MRSIADAPESTVSFERATDHIVAALAPLGSDYQQKAEEFFAADRISEAYAACLETFEPEIDIERTREHRVRGVPRSAVALGLPSNRRGQPLRPRLFIHPSRSTDMTLTLYQLEGCPHCERVVDRLNELDVDFESVWVDGLHSKRNDVKRVSGQRAVPVLVDDERGVTMAESERILEYLGTSYAT